MRVEQIRTALADTLRHAFSGIDGLQVSEYVLGNPTAPGFEIDIDDEGVNYDQAMGRGLDEWWFRVRGFVANATDKGAQMKRDEWLSPSGDFSVKAALEADRTLGGVVQAIRVIQGQPRSWTPTVGTGSVTYSGAEWRIKIMASG